MSVHNEMKVEFLSKSANEAFARVTVAAFISQLDPNIEELSDVKTAVSEAVTNAIIHGYQNSNGIVRIACTLTDKTAEIIIHDDGQGIENIGQARQPLFTSSKNDERSGMGFTVMETFMDELTVMSEPGAGTTIRMVKHFGTLNA
ncbi:MAG: anti-sigma F factor [Hyphomonadaceae bacterium]|nr:anti-sigma F factor [Clostridia bacterium]